MKRNAGCLTMVFILTLMLWGCAAPPEPQPTGPSQGEVIDGVRSQMIKYRNEILKEIKNDPTSPYYAFIDVFEEGIKYCENVESGKVDFDEKALLEKLNKARKLFGIYEKKVSEILGNDVAFGIGKFQNADLLDAGKVAMNGFIEKLAAALSQFKSQGVAGRTPVITIRVIGYADGLCPGRPLEKKLEAEGCFQPPLPADPEMRGPELNRALSSCRAKTVSDYIVSELKNRIDDANVKIDPYIEGKGEEFPLENIEPPFEKEDGRRRICKLYGYVMPSDMQ